MKTIIVTVRPDAQVVVEAAGFQGTACRDATRSLREALGEQADERLKAEFHQPAEVRSQLHAGPND